MDDDAAADPPPPPPSPTPRAVECRFYQSRVMSAQKRMELSARGIEVLPPLHPPSSGEINTTRDKNADVIPWSDVLGASVLSLDALVHVPGYKIRGAAVDSRTDFVIYGCIPKSSAIKKSVLASGLQVLACFGSDPVDGSAQETNDKKRKRSSAPATGPCDRVLVQWVFRYSADDADTFVPHIVQMIRERADPRTKQSSERPEAAPLNWRKYLVLVNPVGGTGNARQVYSSIAAPLLQQSNIECEVVVTEYQHHATEIASKIPLNTYDCVVAVGGDGLLSEIVQGIMKRSDWKEAIRQPLGILPAGSGNGLNATLLYRSGESFDLVNATYALAKGSPQDLDLASVVNGKEDVMYSFLSFEWAFMADVDIDSERYRMFGGMRFTMSAIAKLLSKHKNYTGKVRYLSSDKDSAAPPKYHDRAQDPLEVGAMRPNLDCLSLDTIRDQDIPDETTQEWKELTGPYHMFWGVNVSHTGAQGFLAPNAGIDDGYYYMLVVEGAYSRLNMTRMLFGLEDGTHVGKKQVQLIRTRAFTLQVDNPEDRLCVDGELFSGPEIKNPPLVLKVEVAVTRILRAIPQFAASKTQHKTEEPRRKEESTADMSVRREVISLSQLLQRRKTGPASTGDQRLNLPLSQPAPPSSSRYGPVRQRMSQQPVRNNQQQSTSQLPQRTSQQQSLQQAAPRPVAQSAAFFDAENVNRSNGLAYSQSQEVYDDFDGCTSQSQCSYSQSQNLLYSSQDELNHSRSAPAPRQVDRNALPQDANKPASSSNERTQIDKDVLEEITAPIQHELIEISASLRTQTDDHQTQLESLKAITVNIGDLQRSVQQLHKQNEELNANCNDCQAKIVDHARSMSSAIKSLQSRFDDMENQVEDLTNEVGTLARSRRRERRIGTDSPRSREARWKRKDGFSPSAMYRRSFVDSGGFSHGAQSHSQRGHAMNDIDDDDDDDAGLGLRRSLLRIEAARAKRRRTSFFKD